MALEILDRIGAIHLKDKILALFTKHTSDVNAHITEEDRNKISKVPDDIEGLLNQKYPTTHTHTKIQDSGDGRDLTFKYSIDGLDAAGWFAAWSDNELRAISATGVRNSIDAAQTNHGMHVPTGGAEGQVLKLQNGTPIWGTDNDSIYTHPTSSGNKHIPSGGSSGQFLKWISDGTATWSSITDTDTKNTAGSTNSSSKLFLVGATSQATNPQTYSHDTAYVGTDGHLYSDSKQVVNLSGSQSLTNKTYNGYTLGAACAKGVATSVASGNTSLVTSGAVYTAINDTIGVVNTILNSI